MIPGQRISNRYKILKEIGSGGMAHVYLAEDLILERNVAVKLMQYNFHNDEASIRRFKREALSTTELTHQNIVNVVDVGEEDTPYIVMEYVEGFDLKEFIRLNHPIPYKKSITIMSQILDAVEYAHNHNIIHRDLKPQNILIDHDEKVKITDFGIAVALSENSITQTNSLLGSVHYISPEQARGSMATKQSDIYSLGILLYELLSGEVPFDGESAVSIALKHFQNDMPSLKEKDASLPQPLENVVLKATAKEPKHRYQSVVEMKRDLQTALSAERANEEKFVPLSDDNEETRMIQPISEDTKPVAPVAAAAKVEKPNNEADNRKKAGNTRKSRKKGLLAVIFLLLFLIISLVIFSMTRPREVNVPDLMGLSLEEAVTELEALNLETGQINELHHEEIEEGHVIRTNPSSDAVLRENATVNLYVSLGEERITLDDYTNYSFEDARAELTELGLSVEREESFSSDIAEGNVVSQSITAGDEVIPSQSSITLIVSSGPEGFALRNLTGYSSTGVEEYADELNLSVTITQETHESIPAGQVARQSPEAGTTVFPGSRISVVFSEGPEETEMISFDRGIIIEYEPRDEETDEDDENDSDSDEEQENGSDEETTLVPNEIEIYVDDAENSFDEPYRVFDIFERTPEIITFVVEEGETASFRVVRDGEIIKEETGISPND
ncbi:Stk1 family PASTA domain-containing Ser/Thr kinase [Alkalibacterium sp.]|nr:MAG: Stk1 family PASTA domain-containing Ser/Thr kinase [Alkalibacterium sp.]